MPARTDNVRDPRLAAALLLARRGQAYFSRKVAELDDAGFDLPSRLPGWTRRHVVAHVGYNARAITRLTGWAATGVETPMYSSDTQRADEIEFGAALPVRAIRHLSAHAAVHLDVEWRDLPEDAWERTVRTAQGRLVPARETVWMRTREVWIHAVDLGNGGSFDDFPPALIDALLPDLIAVWSRRAERDDLPPLLLEPTDRDVRHELRPGHPDGPIVVRGRAADLAAWGTGRRSRGVRTADGAAAPAAPRWL